MKDYKLKKDEYINPCDGLVWCRKCNSPRQIKVSGGIYSLSPMVRCSCQQKEWDKEKKRRKEEDRKRYISYLREKGLGWEALREYRFEKDLSGNSHVIKAMRQVPEKFEELPASGFLLWGPHGTGKTFAAACAVNALIDQGIPAAMRSLSDMANEMAALDQADRSGYLKDFFGKRLVCIDDMAFGGDGPVAEAMKRMIMKHWAKCTRPSVITTAYTLSEMHEPKNEFEKEIFGDLLSLSVPIASSGRDMRKIQTERRMEEMKAFLKEA